MVSKSRKDRLRSFAAQEWHQLTTIRTSERPRQKSFAASLAIGLPLLFGAGFDRIEVPTKVGALALGAIGAGLIALVYSVLILRTREPKPVTPAPPPTFDYAVFDSIVIGVSVGSSLLLAQLLGLEKAYWVVVSCLAVIQGTTMRTVWERHIHRILGTTVGLALAWGIFALPLDPWLVALLVIALAFIIETLVVRHYGYAAIFITPMTILLGEAAHFPLGDATQLIHARFIDTVLGSLIGFLGGMAIHSSSFRAALGPCLRRLLGGTRLD